MSDGVRFGGSVYGYQHGDQRARGLVIRGFAVQKHLVDTGLIDKCLSMEDASVWIENPHLYPEEFRRKKVFLWKSTDLSSDGLHIVPCLEWFGGQITVTNVWLGDIWCDTRLAAVMAA
ncbi:MAG: hypothetical protein WAV25_01655 [Minisyncoccia bacterium]